MGIFSKSTGGFREAKGDLILENVTKSFATFTAVDDLSLTVPRGSFFALLGPSGCGKTTTLRMVAGLEQPTAGRVKIGSTDLTGSRPYERPVNTVFQSYALFPHLSVWENIAFGPRMAGWSRSKIADEVARMLTLVKMEDQAEKRPSQISGGQKQRVSIARAFLKNAPVILMDDSLSAVDSNTEKTILGNMRTYLEEKTAIIITHRIFSLLEFDQILVLDKQPISARGTH